MDPIEALRKQFWGDLQNELFTTNSAFWLLNQSLSDLIRTNGNKAHRPILSHPQIGTYTPHQDINFDQKDAVQQTLTVDTRLYAAEDIDYTETNQTPYNLVSHSLNSIRKGLLNSFEQKALSEIPNAFHTISNSPVDLQSSNILDIFEEAEGKLGAFDAPYETSLRAFVTGPRSVATLRRSKSDRESGLGDSVLANGVVGPWQGWTVVQSNNLPWSGTLALGTNPTANDTVTISGVVFKFVASPADPGDVDIGIDAATSRANLKAAVEGGAGEGTAYIELAPMDRFILRRKRAVKVTIDSDNMLFTGFGDIAVTETLTNAANVWSNLFQESCFMIRGAIDAVMQLLSIEIASKEKGFADLPKGLIMVGTRVFSDGGVLMVRLRQDASKFK